MGNFIDFNIGDVFMIGILLMIAALWVSMILFVRWEGKVKLFFRLPVINLFILLLEVIPMILVIIVCLGNPCARKMIWIKFYNKYFKR